jgi:hypothetical protein
MNGPNIKPNDAMEAQMATANDNPGLRDKQKTEALMEIAEALKAIRLEFAQIRADIKAIAIKIK